VESEFAVVGGGILGISIAWGLQRMGRDVVVIDEGDFAFRASRGNFGLVWVQGKGDGLPEYARWTLRSASLWPDFADELEDATGIKLELSQPGGIDFCLSNDEAENAVTRLSGIRDSLSMDYPFEYVESAELRKLTPEIGPDVVGATYCPRDGHVNPLYLLRALYTDFQSRGGQVVNGSSVDNIREENRGFRLSGGVEMFAQKVVLCAGLGNRKLGEMVGLNVPVEPNRGQIVICERVIPFMRYPSVQIRQVGEGAIQIGDSKENVGFDDRTSPEVISRIARRAIKIYPLLSHLRTIRTWAALRVMSPDGFPIYQQSSACPGAYVVTCHSGITLAAVHSLILARWIGGEDQPKYFKRFSGDRFSI